MKGGQPRVSSPLPGSSILMTSAPMSPKDMAQNGPASTRVRSITRMPWSGARGRFVADTFLLAVVATGPSSPETLDHALGDGGDLLAAGARSPPEEPRPIRVPHVGEVEHVVERFHAHARAYPDATRLLTVAEEPGAAVQLDQRDVERRLEAFRRRVKRGERDHLADIGHRGGLHGHGMVGAESRRRHDHPAAPRAARGRQREDVHRRASSSVTQLFVARPPMDWASPTRACTWRPIARPRSCQQSSTICAMPVPASGCPRALSPPEGLTGRRPSRAVSPSRVARPALPTGMSPVSSSEMISKDVKASWSSATSTRSGPKPAIRYAACAASWVARKAVRSFRYRTAIVSEP